MPRKLDVPYDQHLRVLKYRAAKLSLRQIAEREHLSLDCVWKLSRRKPISPDRNPVFLRSTPRERSTSERYWRGRLPVTHKRTSILTVGGCGSAIRVKHGELVVVESGRKHAYLPGIHGIKGIIVEAFGASITLDALAWINRHDIPLIVLCNGKPVAVPASIPIYDVELRRQQYAASLDPLEIARRIVTQKIISGRVAGRLSRLAASRFAAEAAEAKDLDALRLVEANAAFEYYNATPIKLRHKPKLWPSAWTEWTTRTSPIGLRSPRNAVHPINAVLNLAYTVVVNQLTRALAAYGLDPACGFLHSPKDYRASLAYDALELLRADIDKRMLSFLASRAWSRADFPVQKSGVVRLHPALARVVAALAAASPADLTHAAAWMADVIRRAAHASVRQRSLQQTRDLVDAATRRAVARTITGRHRARTNRHRKRPPQ
jgi:CRISPR-associated protein Cas1